MTAPKPSAETDVSARVSVRGLSRSFPGVRALVDVDLDVAPGEIRGIVGANGAGKSTLVRILAGADQADEGGISLDGEKVRFSSPQAAQQAGVFTIYQELSLVPNLSVAENVCLGDWSLSRLHTVDWSATRAVARKDLQLLGFSLDPRLPVASLPMAYQQAVEIVKAVRREARVILLDEPTATLNRREATQLFRLMRILKQRGITLLYISHRIDELYEICDRVTVLRDGRLVGTYDLPATSRQVVVRAMLGRQMAEATDSEARTWRPFRSRDAASTQETALEVSQLRDAEASSGSGVSFSLGRGEVLGVTGLAGNGQAELATYLFGARPARWDQFVVDGKPVQITSPRKAVASGLGLVPEDRKAQGLVLGMSLTSNITLASLADYARRGVLRIGGEQEAAGAIARALSIRAPSPRDPVRNLSGGNQQKVVFAKWLIGHARVLIFDEPTRGVDVGAKIEVHEFIRQFIRDGGSAIVITSEIEEALMCDRVLVLARGRVAGEVDLRSQGKDAESMVLSLFN